MLPQFVKRQVAFLSFFLFFFLHQCLVGISLFAQHTAKSVICNVCPLKCNPLFVLSNMCPHCKLQPTQKRCNHEIHRYFFLYIQDFCYCIFCIAFKTLLPPHCITKYCVVIVIVISWWRSISKGLKYPGMPVTEENGRIFTIDLKDPKMKPVELRMSRNFDLESFNPHGISAITDKRNGNGTRHTCATFAKKFASASKS